VERLALSSSLSRALDIERAGRVRVRGSVEGGGWRLTPSSTWSGLWCELLILKVMN
jgi:hypothetical protein